MKAEGLAGQFAGRQRAGVGQRAVGLALDVALLLPFGVVAEGSDVHGVLHPLDNLRKYKELDGTFIKVLSLIRNVPISFKYKPLSFSLFVKYSISAVLKSAS